MKFSVITTAHIWHKDKMRQLTRCWNSLKNQTYEDFEWVLVDDGSPDGISISPVSVEERIRIYKLPHRERIIALNHALEKAKGDWIVFLDSDDEFLPHALEAMSQMIKNNPRSKMFNYESIHVRKNYSASVRGAFKPKRKRVGHEVFGGGNIVNGTFVFSREIYDKLGAYPTEGRMWNPWDFSIKAQEEFPEIKPYFTADHPDHPEGYPRELGNPWGNDFYLFYKYTRKYKSKPYDVPLIIIHHEGKKEGERHKIDS